MTPVIILTHGEFGSALLKSAEAMLGPQEQIQALSLGLDETREDFATRVCRSLEGMEGAPLALVDIACGTPWNVAVTAGCATRGDVLAGLSLPLLMEALNLRERLDARSLAVELKSRGMEGLQRAGELLAKPGEEA